MVVHFHLLGSFIIGKSRRSSQESRVPVWGAGEGGGNGYIDLTLLSQAQSLFQDEFGWGMGRDADL